MSTIEGGIDVRNIGTSHPLSICVVPVGYDDRAVAFGCTDHLDLFDLVERAGAEAAKCKQKTAYEIIAGDWSSDVCSSDLVLQGPFSDAQCLADLFGCQPASRLRR